MQLQQLTFNYNILLNLGNNTHCPKLPRTVQFCPSPKIAPTPYTTTTYLAADESTLFVYDDNNNNAAAAAAAAAAERIERILKGFYSLYDPK